MPALQEPVPPQTQAMLRRAVLAFKASERRKVFGPVVHVGEPDGGDVSYDVARGQHLEHGLRADVLAALLARAGRADRPPLVWLTRPGELSLHDVDVDWLAAAHSAYAEAGVPLTMVVVTRRGWWDPRSDVRRTWKRLRQR